MIMSEEDEDVFMSDVVSLICFVEQNNDNLLSKPVGLFLVQNFDGKVKMS